MGKLDGKTAIVTGGSGGIGAATGRRFVAEGANVLLVDLDGEALDRVAREIGGDRVATQVADVSDPAAAGGYVAAAVERFGRLDVVFANAGIEGTVCPLVEYPEEDFERVLGVNVKGAFLAIKYALPHLPRGGSIIVTSSIAGLVGAQGLSAYVASKHAVLGLVKVAAIECGPTGVRVNAICPGPIDNRMMRSIEDQSAPGHASEVKAGFEGQVPMGRYGTNEEIAALALFLAGPDSTYCNGGAFVCDGGYVIH